MSVPIKKGIPSTSKATNQKDALETRKSSTTVSKKQWILSFQSYALDRDEPVAVPLETHQVVYWVKPSESQINQLRKSAHSRGYRLVALTENPLNSQNEEF
jgi:hypothetical protein